LLITADVVLAVVAEGGITVRRHGALGLLAQTF
jgi:hypothetical protein